MANLGKDFPPSAKPERPAQPEPGWFQRLVSDSERSAARVWRPSDHPASPTRMGGPAQEQRPKKGSP
jgi:hypothetical protein